MMTEDLTRCQSCDYGRALIHYDSSGLINWVACPRCMKFFEFEKEVKKQQGAKFWDHVKKDTGFDLYTSLEECNE